MAADKNAFVWEDPFLIEDQLSEDERMVRDGVDRLADLASRRMGEAAARYRAGELTAGQFQAEMMVTIKESQVAAALAAHGGRAQMDPAKWGYVGYRVREQFSYARRMIDDVLAGRQRLNGRLDARSRLYGQAARAAYENARRREGAASGFLFERNVLHASESCRGCLNASAAGTVSIGTLPPIGSRQCRSSCRCTLAYSRTMSEAA